MRPLNTLEVIKFQICEKTYCSITLKIIGFNIHVKEQKKKSVNYAAQREVIRNACVKIALKNKFPNTIIKLREKLAHHEF